MMSDGHARARTSELLDREAIRECIYRYCRAVDRADVDLLRQIYWPGATDRHGPFHGSSEGFIDWAIQTFSTIERSVHQIHNILIELKDGGAAVESYYTGLQRSTGPDGVRRVSRRAGRYIDRFEKRDGEWRIAARTVVYDWSEDLPVPTEGEVERFGPRQPMGGRFPDDPVYALSHKKTG